METRYLECERRYVYILLMMSAGYLGGYTYMVRGGVFCNAQTGNMLKMAMAIGQGQWYQAVYFLIPLAAYIAGTILSEYLPERVNALHIVRWDTLLISVEIVVIILVGLLPLSYPEQIAQIAINFICSMQYNTFRQAQHVPMATTFCTNHVRQIGLHLVAWKEDKDKSHLHRIYMHMTMIGSFLAGGISSTFLSRYFGAKTVWGAAILLFIIWFQLFRADMTKDRNLMQQKPAGH